MVTEDATPALLAVAFARLRASTMSTLWMWYTLIALMAFVARLAPALEWAVAVAMFT